MPFSLAECVNLLLSLSLSLFPLYTHVAAAANSSLSSISIVLRTEKNQSCRQAISQNNQQQQQQEKVIFSCRQAICARFCSSGLSRVRALLRTKKSTENCASERKTETAIAYFVVSLSAHKLPALRCVRQGKSQIFDKNEYHFLAELGYKAKHMLPTVYVDTNEVQKCEKSFSVTL